MIFRRIFSLVLILFLAIPLLGLDRRHKVITVGSGGAIPDPFAPITADSRLIWFFHADDPSGVGDGNGVPDWDDRSINDNDATNATGSLQPIWLSGATIAPALNSKSGVLFDGVDDWLGTTSIFVSTSPDPTIMISGIFAGTGIVIGDTGAGTQRLEVDTGTVLTLCDDNDDCDTWAVPIHMTSDAESDILIIRSDGNAWLNGAPLTLIEEAFDSVSGEWTVNEISGKSVGTQDPISLLVRTLIVFDGQLTDSEIDTYAQILADDLAVTYTPVATQDPLELASWKNGVKVGNFPYADTDYREISGGSASFANLNYGLYQSDGSVNFVFLHLLSDASTGEKWALESVSGVDFEDLTSFVANDVAYGVMADMGNNGDADNSRGSGIDGRFYRFPEPTWNSGSGGTIASATIENIAWAYPASGAILTHKDAECLMADRSSGDLYVISKRVSTPSLYRLPYASSYTGTQTLEYVGDIYASLQLETPYDGANGGYVVGCDISPNGDAILLRGHQSVYHFAWDRNNNQTLLEALQATPTVVEAHVGNRKGTRISNILVNEPQGEAVFFNAAGTDFYTASEAGTATATGADANNLPLRHYEYVGETITVVNFQNGVSPAAEYVGCEDTYIGSAAPTTDFSTAISLIADYDLPGPSQIRQVITGWDITSIPDSATIVQCNVKHKINTEGNDFCLYDILGAWDHQETFDTMLGGSGVAMDDVEAESTAFAEHGAPAVAGTTHGYNTLLGWTTTPIPIEKCQAVIVAGILDYLIDNCGTSGDGLQFDSCEDTTSADRPILTVGYY